MQNDTNTRQALLTEYAFACANYEEPMNRMVRNAIRGLKSVEGITPTALEELHIRHEIIRAMTDGYIRTDD